MLTFEDCLGLSELTEEEILAIAEHEHVPELIALELGNLLVRTHDGEECLKRFIVDDIAAARTAGNLRHAAMLKRVLRQYCRQHHV